MTASLSQLIEKEAITVWYSVPLALIQLLHRGVLDERNMAHLRWVLFAGEVFPTKYLRELMRYWPQARFSNIYGPAETNQCTNFNLDIPPETDDPIPLGEVWEDTQMLILDEHEQEVPQGEIGELLIRSATMMRGYWKRPDLTEKSFYRKQTIPGFQETYYRTGDLVRQDAEGLLHFLGRKDQQIKTRGYRVELEAVEHQLGSLSAVKEAAVFPYRNTAEEVVIIGAVILHHEQDVEEKELIALLKEHLPWYAIPGSIFKLDDFPRTGTEKIDRPGLNKLLSEKIKQLHG
jgi:acyl-coenzyme A synthetase/AMP-(fatty) acid ligase